MAVIPLIPLFHDFNKFFFVNSFAIDFEPTVKLRWSDDRLKTIAGFYNVISLMAISLLKFFFKANFRIFTFEKY